MPEYGFSMTCILRIPQYKFIGNSYCCIFYAVVYVENSGKYKCVVLTNLDYSWKGEKIQWLTIWEN